MSPDDSNRICGLAADMADAALTDPASLDLRKDVPMKVPSGLPVFD